MGLPGKTGPLNTEIDHYPLLAGFLMVFHDVTAFSDGHRATGSTLQKKAHMRQA
jgi:hypothetical protein